MAIYRSGNAFADSIAGLGSIATAIARLAPKKRGTGRLGPAPDREGLSESVARIYPGSGDSASGVASPLSEVLADREYWASTSTVESSCGLFVITYNPIKSRTFEDANGDTLVFLYEDPNAE